LLDCFSGPDGTPLVLAAMRLATALIPDTSRIDNPHEIVRRMMKPSG
jgi:hypothetical protein